MNKKILTISLVAVAAIASSVAIASTFKKSSLGQFTIANANNYEIVLNGDKVTPGTYDTTNWVQPFSINGADAIKVSETEKYELEFCPFVLSDWSGTYVYGDDSFTFKNNNNIVEFECQGYENVSISFKLLKRANIDLDKTVIDMEIADLTNEKEVEKGADPIYADPAYSNVKFSLEDESDPTYNVYNATFEGYSHYGDIIYVNDVKIVFSC